MRIIVHISDMHFSKIDKDCLKPMLKAIRAVNPHLIIISGDFTQRARVREYEEAAAFIKKLEHPYFVIPGNHDIRPLINPLKRILSPYDRYKKYISQDLTPKFVDKEIAVAAVNTVRSAALKDGRVSKRQIDVVTDWFKTIPEHKIKLVVTHHPFHLPMDWSDFRLARKSKMAIQELSESGIDMFLSGHFHLSSVTHTAERYKIENYSAVAVQAGTVSSRTRKAEVQSFNLIFIDGPHIRIDTYLFDEKKKRFDLETSNEFAQKKKSKEWVQVKLSKS